MARYLEEVLAAGLCPTCQQPKDDIDEQYSYGVYAGVMCTDCARRKYRDHCGHGALTDEQLAEAGRRLAELLAAGKSRDCDEVQSVLNTIDAARGSQGNPADLDEPIDED